MPPPQRREARSLPLRRGLRGRCPNCGGGGLFRGVTDIKDVCPTCGLSFIREDGYWVGAMIVLMAWVLVIFGVWSVGGMLLLWPDVPWTGLVVGGVILNAVVPFTFYAWSKTIWIGLDLTFNPARADEFVVDRPDAGHDEA